MKLKYDKISKITEVQALEVYAETSRDAANGIDNAAFMFDITTGHDKPERAKRELIRSLESMVASMRSCADYADKLLKEKEKKI